MSLRPEEILSVRLIPGWLSDREIAMLADAAAGRQAIVELGSWKGRSTAALAFGCRPAGGTVYAVDHWRGSAGEREGPHQEAARHPLGVYREFLGHMARLGVLGGTVVPVLSDHLAAAAIVPGPVELLFVDGEHTEAAVLAQVAAWRPLLAPGALVLFHDAAWPGVAAALRSLEGGVERSPDHSIATWRIS